MDLGTVKSAWEFFTPPEFDDLIELMEIEDMEDARKATKLLSRMKGWGWKISGTFTVLVLYTIWSLTPWGFVQAADQKKYVSQVEKRVAEVDGKLTGMQGALNELLAQKVATDICRIVKRSKTEADPLERNGLREELDAAQRRYRSLDPEKKDYPEDRCQ